MKHFTAIFMILLMTIFPIFAQATEKTFSYNIFVQDGADFDACASKIYFVAFHDIGVLEWQEVKRFGYINTTLFSSDVSAILSLKCVRRLRINGVGHWGYYDVAPRIGRSN